MEILWVKVSNIPLGIYIYINIYCGVAQKTNFFFSLAPQYLHLKIERYSELLSKLDSYAGVATLVVQGVKMGHGVHVSATHNICT